MKSGSFDAVPLLDEGRVRMFDRRLGAGFRSLVDEYFLQCADGAAEMEQLARAGDMTRLRETAHRLKGASSSVGMSRLHDFFAAVEDQARAGGPVPPSSIAAVPELIDRTRKALCDLGGS